MGLPIFVVDAFTSEPFGGNPAGVVLDHGDEAWMQRVAAEMRHSETAFVRPRAEKSAYDLRWFTPEVEVSLCGHATLASAHVLFDTGRAAKTETIVFQTRGGELRATDAGRDGVTLDFPISRPTPLATADAGLYAALRLEPGEFLESDGDFFVCVVDDAATVRALDPQERQAGDAFRNGGSIERASEILDWEPRVSIREAVAAQLAWHKARV